MMLTVIGAITTTCFNVQHWIFALSYLKVAVNFKLIFSVDSDAITQKLTKRNSLLSIVEYIGLFAVIVTNIIFEFLSDESYWTFLTTYYFTIVSILGFSIYRIRKYSKLLVKNKIFVNECLMITHLISFAGIAIACLSD